MMKNHEDDGQMTEGPSKLAAVIPSTLFADPGGGAAPPQRPRV